ALPICIGPDKSCMMSLNLAQGQKSKHFRSHCERKGDVTGKKLYIPNYLIAHLLKFARIKQRKMEGGTLLDRLCPPEALLLVNYKFNKKGNSMGALAYALLVTGSIHVLVGLYGYINYAGL